MKVPRARRKHLFGGDLGLLTLGSHDGAELSECGSFSVTSTVPLEVTPQWPPDDEFSHLGCRRPTGLGVRKQVPGTDTV